MTAAEPTALEGAAARDSDSSPRGRLKDLIGVNLQKKKQFLTGSEDDFYRLYTLGKKIGEGAFATVHECVENKTKEDLAVKLVDKGRAGMGQLHDLMHEVNVMKGLQHSSIVSLLGSFEGADAILIVMNRIKGGTLFDRIIKHKHYTEEMAAEAMKNLLSALAYIHKAGIAHRDIKPENLLLTTEYNENEDTVKAMTDVVIADFGLASREPMKATCGSPCYVAPEVIIAGFGEQYGRKSAPYTTQCDVWSLGVVLFVMLSGRFPFSVPGNSRSSLFNLILTADVHFSGPAWAEVSDDAKDFLRQLLNKDPKHRPSAQEMQQHRWITGKDLASPLKRVTSLVQSMHELKEFTMRKHVIAAMSVYRVAGSLFTVPEGEKKAFRKYVIPGDDPFDMCITVQSQSDAKKVYTVDLAKLGRRVIGNSSATTAQAHRLQTTCECPSARVCRHVQYVYQWLFMGDMANDVVPHMIGCEELRLDLVDKVSGGDKRLVTAMGGAVAAAAGLSGSAVGKSLPAMAITSLLGAASAFNVCNVLTANTEARRELLRAEEFILAAWKFKHAFDLTPETDRKSVLSSDLATKIVSGWKATSTPRIPAT